MNARGIYKLREETKKLYGTIGTDGFAIRILLIPVVGWSEMVVGRNCEVVQTKAESVVP